MKKILLILIAFFLAKQAVSDDKLLPLNKIIDDTQKASYVFKRCSGLYISLVGISSNEINKQIALNYLSASEQFYQTAFFLDFKKNMGSKDYVANLVTNQITSISKIYRKRMDNNYLIEGQSLGNDEVIKGDIKICEKIFKMSK
jgi:hypothetical protein